MPSFSFAELDAHADTAGILFSLCAVTSDDITCPEPPPLAFEQQRCVTIRQSSLAGWPKELAEAHSTSIEQQIKAKRPKAVTHVTCLLALARVLML